MKTEIIPLDYLTVIQFQGRDAADFLQSQLTADLRGLEDSDAMFACACNPAGRVLGLLLIRSTAEDGFLALCSAALAESLKSHLARFVLRAKVEIRLRDDLAVQGTRDPGIEQPGALRFDSTAGVYQVITGAGKSEAAPGAAAVDCWRASELVHGVHWLEEATSGKFLPQMLGYERIGALSFSKGCYPGQEVIARTRHLGKLKRHPIACQLDQHVHVQPMSEAILTDGQSEASAVLVHAVNLADGHGMAMLVARMPADFAPRSCFIGPAPFGIEWSGTPDPAVRMP